MKEIDKLIQEVKDSKPQVIPEWEGLKKQYDPSLHAVMTDKILLKDIVKNGGIDYSSRVVLGMQKSAARKMTQMAFSIPVQRIYNTGDDPIKKAQAFAIEQIYKRAGIDSINIDRFHALFSCCEIATIWYPAEGKNNFYGFNSNYKLKCITYSPMDRKYSKLSEAGVYPVFDRYNDLIKLGFETTVKEDGKDITYFHLLEADHDTLYRKDKTWEEVKDDKGITIGKIPGIYWLRTTPIWEEQTSKIHEIELALSREGNIIKKNSAPILGVTGKLVDERPAGEAAREVYQFEDDGKIEYITWAQQIDAMKFFVETLKHQIEEELQLPNLSMDKIIGIGTVSGEARKTLLIDPHLKVGYESGSIIKGLERECNVIKAFLGEMNAAWKSSINDLEVEHVITPFVQNDEGAEVDKLTKAAGKAIMAQKTAIKMLGMVENVDEEYNQILEEEERDKSFGMFEPTE